MICWIDGRLAPVAEASVPVLSNAVFRGTTVFDVMAVVPGWGGSAVVGLDLHIERFMASMRSMYMTPAVCETELVAGIAAVVGANPGTGVVRLVALWDANPSPVPADRTPRVVITAEPAGPPPRASIRLCSATAKIANDVLPTHIKVAAMYTPGVRADVEARLAGFDSIVNRSSDDYLVEGVSSSVIIVSQGCLLAPPLGNVLDSITRRLVLDASAHTGIPSATRPVSWEEVRSAEAAFMSSTTAPLVPISCIDDMSYAVDDPVVLELTGVVNAILTDDHPLAERWLSPLR